jgi:hypothetical protein
MVIILRVTWLLLAAVLACAIRPVTAQVTDPERRIPIEPLPRPALHHPVEPSPFGVTLVRVGGDPGEPLALTGDASGPQVSWGTRSTHHAFKDQPWNADQTFIWLRNAGDPGRPRALLLDAATLRPAGACAGYSSVLQGGDDRWHPSAGHRLVRVGVTGRSPRRLVWYDAGACRVVREADIPAERGFSPRGIGDGEGNLTQDGRYVFLHDRERLEGRLVDMQPAAPCPAGTVLSGGMCFGPVLALECGLTGASCTIGHTSLSPSGRSLVVKHTVKGRSGASEDLLRIYSTDLARLTAAPRVFPRDPPCRPVEGVPLERGDRGFIFRLAHEDIAANSFEGGREHAVGARRMACGDSAMSRVVMVDLETGLATGISPGDPRTEEAPHHVSARATGRPGWVYVTYRSDTTCRGGCRFRDEIVAFPMKPGGGGSCERWGHVRSDLQALPGDDDDEGQAVPSPDGRQIIFRSSWSREGTCPAGGCGRAGQVNAYVLRPAAAAGPEAARPSR